MRYVVLSMLLGCVGSPGANCGNLIDLGCDQGVCFCAGGPLEGVTCDIEAGPDDPAGCEMLCAYCELEQHSGPSSVLLGG